MIVVQVIVEQDPKHPYPDVKRSAVRVRRGESVTQTAWMIGTSAKDVAPSILKSLAEAYPDESVREGEGE